MEINARKAQDKRLIRLMAKTKEGERAKGEDLKKSIFNNKDGAKTNILALIDKDKADELFMFNNFGESGQQLFQTKNYKKVIEYKKNKYITTAMFEKIKLVLNLKGVDRILYIKLLLKKIDLAKKLFILEIEQGDEVFIPAEISVD